jgi:insertion element IS1 protein InsB
MNYVASDYWKPYQRIIPQEKHIQSKAETFTVEGYNFCLGIFWQE